MRIIRKNDGFSLIELMVAMVSFVFVIYAASNIFTRLMNQFKQQTKIAEMNIEGVVGLEMLRQDIFRAGYGLPWIISGGVNYNEAAGANALPYNDSVSDDPPRAILSGNNIAAMTNASDYLVIKGANVAISAASQKWTKVFADNSVEEWAEAGEILANGDAVVVVTPGTGSANFRALIDNSGAFYTTYVNAANDSIQDVGGVFVPPDNTEVRWAYGVANNGTTPRMPFNRADYFVNQPSNAANMPSQCANPGTGILFKAVINHSGGSYEIDATTNDPLPVLDCVADFQVAFGVDTDVPRDGQVNCYTNDLALALATVDAANIRERVKEVRAYILTHEGQYDNTYTIGAAALNGACANCIRVGEALTAPMTVCEGGILGRDLDLSGLGLTTWQNYRWRVYTMFVYPFNLSYELPEAL